MPCFVRGLTGLTLSPLPSLVFFSVQMAAKPARHTRGRTKATRARGGLTVGAPGSTLSATDERDMDSGVADGGTHVRVGAQGGRSGKERGREEQ